MLKRLKNLWKQSETGPVTLELSKLSTEQLEAIGRGVAQVNKVEGDGKAEFLGSGSEEEFKEQQREDKGIKGIFGL